MVKHVVLFEFKSSCSPDTVTTIMNGLGALKDNIPGIVGYSWGTNNSPEGLNRKFEHGFVMEFSNTKDRDQYLDHPDHRTFGKEHIHPNLANGRESVLVFDYET